MRSKWSTRTDRISAVENIASASALRPAGGCSTRREAMSSLGNQGESRLIKGDRTWSTRREAMSSLGARGLSRKEYSRSIPSIVPS
jgi:hypothetical protein